MIKYAEKQTIKNIITNEGMHPDGLDYAWQEFVNSRQDSVKENNESFEKIEGLLNHISEEKLMEDIKDAVIDREYKVAFIRYNKGFLDGMKLALKLGGL
jgi:hypothetical protein